MENFKIIVLLSATFIASHTSAGIFKIIDIAPTQTIQIGSKQCGVNDVFEDKDIIHWDTVLANQAIKVICIQPECKNMIGYSMNMSKKQFRKHTGKDISYNKLVSLVSKGDEVKEPVVLWSNDTIPLNIKTEDNYTYYCKVKGLNIKEPLIILDRQIYVAANTLLKYRYKGTFAIEIVQTHTDNPLDTKIISSKEVETVSKK